jgi:MarR family transcriptional regulator, transcriptional regulator for hemolysin
MTTKTKKIAPGAAQPTGRKVAPQPYLRLGFLVHDVSRMRRTLFDQAVKKLDITRAQWWALANLSRHESEGMIQSDLARELDVGKVTVGGLIDRLELSGHVERRADPSDRRLRRVFITPRGYDVIEQMQSIGRDLNGVIMKGVHFDQIHVAEDVLHQMKENLRDALSLGNGLSSGGDSVGP